jgi:hypothetical protein
MWPALRVEHAQALRHVVERRRQLSVFRAGALVKEDHEQERGDAQARDQHKLAGCEHWQAEYEHEIPAARNSATMSNCHCDKVNV